MTVKWSKGRGLAAIAAVATIVALAAASSSAAPSLTVTDLGQPSAPVEVGQAPVEVSPAGSCPTPFTLAAACPVGSWPALGGPWGPTLDVAGGDVLGLAFPVPVSDVVVASTTNFPPGLVDPSGTAVANRDVMAATPAVATSDPSSWTVALPPLDRIAMGGLTFSVVASDGAGGSYDYPLAIRTPRYGDESRRCGPAYFSTGDSQYLCLVMQKAPPPLPPLMPPRAGPPPSVRPVAASLASVEGATFKRGRLRLNVSVPAAGTLHLTVVFRHRNVVVAIRHPLAAGSFRVSLRLRHQHFSKAHHRIALRMSLHTSTGAYSRTQAVPVSY
jgi:hypothetical protein